MDVTYALIWDAGDGWKNNLHKHVLTSEDQNLLQKKTNPTAINATTPPVHPDRPPPPPPLVTSTPTSVVITSPITPVVTSPIASADASDSPSMGTIVLRIAIGSVAAFIVVPALAVVAYLYVRRWRNQGKKYGSIEDDEIQDEYGRSLSGTRHKYHDEIQLKDYEAEGKPSFEEVGPLAEPASAVHVFPAAARQPSIGGNTQALGSGTIRSPGT
ncbi:hypothetical protein AB5N19_00602 [Seiridium cardinale]|uniref:Uncharacterized protein n=1 Tax=Seiridium cardinale TaxID=138064 RepID=A0ABR2XF69_9PEZI